MIKINKYSELGFVDHGWLKARHHFSFASYYNPKRMGFGNIRVINDDIIDPKCGFNPHSHSDMEIITFVREGAITHQDNQNNEGKTFAGDIQVMSAGTGITHSEYNLETVKTNIYQIWIVPNKKSIKPRWEAKSFSKNYTDNKLQVLVSGFGESYIKNTIGIYQDTLIYGGKIKKKINLEHESKYQSYILCSKGKLNIENKILHKGDSAEIKNIKKINIKTLEDSEIIIIDTK